MSILPKGSIPMTVAMDVGGIGTEMDSPAKYIKRYYEQTRHKGQKEVLPRVAPLEPDVRHHHRSRFADDPGCPYSGTGHHILAAGAERMVLERHFPAVNVTVTGKV